MSILGPIEVDQFIHRYWQSKPLLIRNAIRRFEDVLSVEELAGLSLEKEVESRLIQWHSASDKWDLEHGPFKIERFAELPDINWTLLVQAVDQWVPEVAEILDEFNFLPKWRLDDVMISYAAPGGGVGPHFDYYDVFLLQVKGTRQWRIGQQCDENSALRLNQPLKLLERFDQSTRYVVRPGDMLYIPAGIAHWGVAGEDGSITYSIGSRAPSAAELLVSAAERIAATLPEDLRYRDMADLRGGSKISRSVDMGLENLFKNIGKKELIEAAKEAFVSQITEPRYIEAAEPLSGKELTSTLEDIENETAFIERSPHSRFAYYRASGEESDLYVDGIKYAVTPKLAKMICDEDIELRSDNREIISQLLQVGALIVV